MSKNIVLVGLMGTGKTSIGKYIAKKTGMNFVDTDELIVLREKKPIHLIFKEDGEKYFRKIEAIIIKEVSSLSKTVISTGGGVLLKTENLENLKQNGILFHLFAPAEDIFNRIKYDKTRPLLDNSNPIETLKKLQKDREAFYNKANYTIDTAKSSIQKASAEIISLYSSLSNF